MSAAPVIESAEPAGPDAVLQQLAEALDRCRSLVAERHHAPAVEDEVRIDRIAVLERLQSLLLFCGGWVLGGLMRPRWRDGVEGAGAV